MSKSTTTIKKKTPVKSSTKKVATKKSTVKKPAKKSPETVDYYPNRVTVAALALVGTLLVLVTLITVLGSQ